MSHIGDKPSGWDGDAILQDVNDLVDRMRVAYRDDPMKAATVLANALGVVCAHAERCGDPKCIGCTMDTMAMCANMNHVVTHAAISELKG